MKNRRALATIVVLCLSLFVSSCGSLSGGPYPPPEDVNPPLEQTPYPPPEPTIDVETYTPPAKPTETTTPAPIPTVPPTAMGNITSAFDVLWAESVSEYSPDLPKSILWQTNPVDIAARQEIVHFDKATILNAALSPDGQRVALITKDGQQSGQPLWVVDIDGANLRQLAPSAGQILWTRDSQTICYIFAEEGWVGIRQVVMDTEETQVILKIESTVGVYLIGWSADGNWLYHLRAGPGKQDLWKVRRDGSSSELIAALETNLSYRNLVLSPGGTRLLYNVAQSLKWVSTVDGDHGEIPLPNPAGGGYQVFWGSTEDEVFVAQRDGNQPLYRLYTTDISGASVQELGSFGIPRGSGWAQLAISPDHEWLMGNLTESDSYLIYLPNGTMVPVPDENRVIQFAGWVSH